MSFPPEGVGGRRGAGGASLLLLEDGPKRSFVRLAIHRVLSNPVYAALNVYGKGARKRFSTAPGGALPGG